MAASSSSAAAATTAAGEEEQSGVLNATDAVPFMLQVLMAIVVAWLFVPVTFKGFVVVCCLGTYLLEVEKSLRKRQRSEIASAERQKLNTEKTFEEGETSRWLNEGIKRMWPVCMQKFASQYFFGPMAPYFLERFKPGFVKEAKVDVASLYLGSAPPVFNCVRALERPPDGDHLAYEAEVDFLASNDMTAQMLVLLKGGLGATFYISNLHIEGKVRISVKFLTGWPVVGRVRICFASTPQVTMSYRPYYRNFPDASLMPKVANAVMKALENAMGQSIVQPHMLEVDLEALATMLAPSSQGAPALDVLHVQSKPTLVVEILEATNLIVADRNGFSDPYVEIQFGPQKERTKVMKKTLNPKWQDEQHLFVVDWNRANFLTLEVRDSDRVRYRPSYELGILTVSVNELYKGGMKLDEDGKPYEVGKRYEFNRPLEKVKRGQLRFAITLNHALPPPAFEAPRTSDGASQTGTQTQEIKSAVDFVVNDLAGVAMPKSKSDTNLDRLGRTPPKGKSKVAAAQEELQKQAASDETRDVIIMPYGPRGAFRIFHPGSVSTRAGPVSTRAGPATRLVDEPEPPVRPASRLRNPFRVLARRKKPSQEMVLTENMRERSGSVGSADDITELKLFTPAAGHASICMNLIEAPGEPPEMGIHPPAPQLSSLISGKTASTAPASTAHPVQALHDVTDDDEETTASLPLAVGNPGPPPSTVPIARRDHDQLQPSSGPHAAKSNIRSLPKRWYKKAKSLATKRKKPHGDDGRVSRSESLMLSPLDTRAHRGSAPSSLQGDSPELRQLVHETHASRAAGSQSDRPARAATRVMHWFRDRSQPCRSELLHSRPPLQAPAPPHPSSHHTPGPGPPVQPNGMRMRKLSLS